VQRDIFLALLFGISLHVFFGGGPRLLIGFSMLQVDLSTGHRGQQLVMGGDARLVGDLGFLQLALVVPGDFAQREIRLVRHDWLGGMARDSSAKKLFDGKSCLIGKRKSI